jgi:hypothetical protein
MADKQANSAGNVQIIDTARAFYVPSTFAHGAFRLFQIAVF